MFKLLSRKLLGVKCKSGIKSLLISAVIGYSLSSIGSISLSNKVLVLTVIFFTGTMVIQTLSSKENSKLLRGLFAMPCQEKRTLWEYAAAVGAYVIITKLSLVAALFAAFAKVTPLRVTLFMLGALYAVFGGMAAFGHFRKRPYISAAFVAGGIAMSFLLPSGTTGVMIMAAADLAAAAVMSFTPLDNFRVRETSAKRKVTHRSGIRLLIPRYVGRYLLENKNYIVSSLITIAFSVFLALNSQKLGLFMGCGMGMALISVNSPMAVIVSSNRGLDRKLNALPAKTRSFFLPYGCVLFCFYMISFAVYLAAFCIAGGHTGIRAFIIAPVFAAESAAFVAMLENRFTIRNWKSEPDLWHNPRKYILPVLLMLESAAVFAI